MGACVCQKKSFNGFILNQSGENLYYRIFADIEHGLSQNNDRSINPKIEASIQAIKLQIGSLKESKNTVFAGIFAFHYLPPSTAGYLGLNSLQSRQNRLTIRTENGYYICRQMLIKCQADVRIVVYPDLSVLPAMEVDFTNLQAEMASRKLTDLKQPHKQKTQQEIQVHQEYVMSGQPQAKIRRNRENDEELKYCPQKHKMKMQRKSKYKASCDGCSVSLADRQHFTCQICKYDLCADGC